MMSKYGLAAWVVLLGPGLMLPALAATNEPPRSEAAAGPEHPQAPGGAGAKTEREEIVIHTQRAMDELRAAVEELRKQADKASGEAREGFERQLRSLQEEQQKLEKKFRELQAATVRQWKELREEIERAVKEFDRPAEKPHRDTI